MAVMGSGSDKIYHVCKMCGASHDPRLTHKCISDENERFLRIIADALELREGLNGADLFYCVEKLLYLRGINERN